MSNHINEILFALTDAEVEFVVGGGVAAVLHAVERVTLDIDLALDMDPANVEKFSRDARKVVIENRAIKIMGISKLLETKRAITPLRDKDLIDIKQLEKLQSQSE